MNSSASDGTRARPTWIAHGDPRWARTLAWIDEPLPGEGIWGFLLRLDELNGATPGSVFRLITQYGIYPPDAGNRVASQWVGTAMDFGTLATVTNNPEHDIVHLTYRRQLLALRIDEPHSRLVGIAPPFQICVPCIRASKLIKLEFTLPGIDTCVEHGTRLIARCACNAPLRPWHPTRRSAPFACPVCELTWESLPVSAVPSPHRTMQRRLLHTYAVFLGGGSSRFLVSARLVAFYAADPRWYAGFYPDEVQAQRVAARSSSRLSLGSLATLFVALQIAPERVAEFPTNLPVVGPCVHRGCQGYGSDRWIRVLAARRRGWDSYCLACGSRFIGDRIVVSYFFDHGDTRLSDCAVRTSAALLARWHQTLAEACARDRTRSRTPMELFDDAGIPRWPNLKSPALGLIDILRAHLGTAGRWRYPGAVPGGYLRVGPAAP